MNLQELVPAVRMTLSKGRLKSCNYLTPDEIAKEQLDKLSGKLEGLIKTDNHHIDGIMGKLKTREAETCKYLYVKDTALICIGDSKSQADILRSNVQNIISGGEAEKLPIQDSQSGRLQSKIALVTGAAQGFGKGIAEELFKEGACIVIADINEEPGKILAGKLNENSLSNKAFFCKTDVSDEASVEKAIRITVKEFGGIDILISNAGVLRAGGLDEMEPATFRFMTDINYTGYFYCSKYASSIMKIQNRYNKNYFFDIIQINSKSGLSGSKKNFAYAGGKFGGIGLTQSFALELITSNIKVNSICPGNFFEGPLWSDPEEGLFNQYLKAGKVPGAKTIDDVRRFYESQVPAGRGCRIKDVSRAILYAIEQEYETGQAIPVTGGQNMLH